MKRNLLNDYALRRWARRAGCVLGMSICLWMGAASATSLTALDLPTLSHGADRVLLGTVERVDSHFLGDGGSYIVTDVTIRCEKELLGVPAGSRFVVRHLGGVVGELGQRVHGEASYRAGEQVLLFAKERGGAFFAMGMAQGAMHVFRDGAGVPRVDIALDQAELVGPTGQAAAAAANGRTLDDVLATVRSLLAQRPQSAKGAPATTPASQSVGGSR